MKTLEQLKLGAEAYRICKGLENASSRGKYAKKLLVGGVFTPKEIEAICNVKNPAMRRWEEYKYRSKRYLGRFDKFNPSSLPLFYVVRRALLESTPLLNGHFVTLYNDGNDPKVIGFFTGVSHLTVRRRLNGKITAEWFDHAARLRGLEAWEKRVKSGNISNHSKGDRNKSEATQESDSTGIW